MQEEEEEEEDEGGAGEEYIRCARWVRPKHEKMLFVSNNVI